MQASKRSGKRTNKHASLAIQRVNQPASKQQASKQAAGKQASCNEARRQTNTQTTVANIYSKTVSIQSIKQTTKQTISNQQTKKGNRPTNLLK